MKPTKEIIEKAARRGALLQNVQLIMWEFVKKRESDESVNWIEYAGKIVDVVEGKDTPEGKLISTYKDKLWDKNLELDPDDDTPKETWDLLKKFEAKWCKDKDSGLLSPFCHIDDVSEIVAQAKAAVMEKYKKKIRKIGRMKWSYTVDGKKVTPVTESHYGYYNKAINDVLATLREDYKV